MIVYAACMPEHGIADDAASRQARLAVDSRAFPLFTYDPRRGDRISERLSLQGNPAVARGLVADAGRRAGRLPRLRPDARAASRRTSGHGEPTTGDPATNEDRLANWRTLQELAGIRFFFFFFFFF